MEIFIAIFTVVLALLSIFVVLVILMQKPSANANMGSALGGGAAEQAFGGETVNILTKTTIYSIIIFFIIGFLLYLGNLANADRTAFAGDGTELRNIASDLVEDAPAEEETPAEDGFQVTPLDEGEVRSLDDILDGSAETTESTK